MIVYVAGQTERQVGSCRRTSSSVQLVRAPRCERLVVHHGGRVRDVSVGGGAPTDVLLLLWRRVRHTERGRGREVRVAPAAAVVHQDDTAARRG